MISHLAPSMIPSPQPATFAGLMEIYETNYINLRRLCGNFNSIEKGIISEVQEGLDLYLSIIDRTKYTVTIKLTYQFLSQDSTHMIDYPDLLVRVYFDAKQAEVLNVSRLSINNLSFDSRLSQKWQPNRFLYKWLKYCINQGHTFKFEHSSLIV